MRKASKRSPVSKAVANIKQYNNYGGCKSVLILTFGTVTKQLRDIQYVAEQMTGNLSFVNR